MRYYEIYVADKSYRSVAPLTYQHPDNLVPGTLVLAPLKRQRVQAVVVRQVAKPSFATKSLVLPALTAALPIQLTKLAVWMTTYYPSGIGVTLQQFLPQKFYPDPTTDGNDRRTALPSNSGWPPLTDEQRQALGAISQPNTYLLHGETGSGKTRIYMELARRCLDSGRSAIILTPEIGLTPQLQQSFAEAFGAGRVNLTHSHMTAKQRGLLWSKMLHQSEPQIVLGPRSALFSPLHKLGLIVIDESHESSYKQEQAPHYHTSTVAAKLAGLHQAILVLGSATPTVTDYFLAEAKARPIIRLRHTAQASSPVTTAVIDLTKRQHFNRQPHLSDELIAAINGSLQRHEQSLVFLNRRGTARLIVCQRCGWQAHCPHCDLPLTYHGDSHRSHCHTCGYNTPTLTNCPNCGSNDIIFKSVGTKAIASELATVFPGARLMRFDTDNTKEERLELHFDDIKRGQVDILVGTQLIAKGLDLPLLSTVGVVVADTSLYLPDYSASERTYQLLRQVIGRVGRGHRPANVVIQTYDPNSAVIKAVASGTSANADLDKIWHDYYGSELAERRAFLFPPYVYTLKIWCRRATAAGAQTTAQKAVEALRASGLRITVDGPMPAFHEKAAGKFQWQAIVKARDRQQLLAAISLLPANWSFDIDPNNLL